MQHFQKKARGKEEKMKNWHTKKKEGHLFRVG
jgi:hypothetical protein